MVPSIPQLFRVFLRPLSSKRHLRDPAALTTPSRREELQINHRSKPVCHHSAVLFRDWFYHFNTFHRQSESLDGDEEEEDYNDDDDDDGTDDDDEDDDNDA